MKMSLLNQITTTTRLNESNESIVNAFHSSFIFINSTITFAGGYLELAWNQVVRSVDKM